MKLRLTLLILLISAISFSQNGINYKALIKDANGNVIANQSIDIVFSIQHESVTQFSELQQIVTDNNGIAIAIIGEGSPITGTFDAIDWKLRNLELNVQIDLGDGLVDFGNSSFNAVPYAINTLKPQGLEAINEGNGVGWRLAGSNVDSYGNIGLNAIDLSISNSTTENYGAKGQNSFAAGFSNEASGAASTTLGLGNIASGNISTAFGNGTIASAVNSTAIGLSTQATANVSTAMGYNTIASAVASTAMGQETEASGANSVAMGFNTEAQSYASTSIGRYNVGGGNATEWFVNDPLFEIGNGSSDSNRSNALTVNKSGRHIINSEDTGLIVFSNDYGISIYPTTIDGLNVSAAGRYGANIRGDSAGLLVSSSVASNPDIILDGNSSANDSDDGIIASDPSYAGSDIYLRSNDAVVIQLDHDNSENGNFYIQDSNGDEVFSVNEAGNVNIEGDVTGLSVRSSISSNPDIILRGNSSANTSDDGIIASDPAFAGSDIYLRSNDALVVELDNDDNGSGSFLIRNSTNSNAFTVNESGNVTMGSLLQMESINIERNTEFGGNYLEINSNIMPSNDNEFFLGFPTNRWIRVYSVNGVSSTSDRRVKKNIKDLNYGLHEILQMQPVSFNWKNKNDPDTKLGLIAQDLQALIPEVVNTHLWEKDKTTGLLNKKQLNRLGVYYSDLIPVLINAIKEQHKIIESQGDALKTSNNNFEVLLSRIEILESKSSN